MAKSETCSRCGEEVRWGWRDGQEAYWHREQVDHVPIFGRYMTPEEVAENTRRYREEVFYLEDGTPYTAAQADASKFKDTEQRRRALAELAGEDPDYIAPTPPVEILGHAVQPDSFPPRSGIRQVINLVEKKGWYLARLTKSRGPYLGADGSVLSISDCVVLGAVSGPPLCWRAGLDSKDRFAVGSWRDGKFDFAYIGVIGRAPTKVDSPTLKKWIKGIA